MKKKVVDETSEINYDTVKKDTDQVVKGQCWYEVVWDYQWKKIKHFVVMKEDIKCIRCWKELKKEPVCYREVSHVWLLLWFYWLTEIYLCCDCALKQWKTNYWAKIIKSNKTNDINIKKTNKKTTTKKKTTSKTNKTKKESKKK